jgi:release factor glutamine methyltransferase
MITNPSEDYARGWVPFLDCKIFLDSRPLIPRSETEFWVQKFLDENRRGTAKILDLFSGNGCIGIAVLKHAPNATVDFGEIETRHFPTIEKSLKENRASDVRFRFLKTDVWSGITGRYDFILANPPYLDESATIAKSVRKLEPREALFADNDGFALIEKTIVGAKEHLLPHGELWLEHDPEQAERLTKLGKKLGFKVITNADQYGNLRYSVMA